MKSNHLSIRMLRALLCLSLLISGCAGSWQKQGTFYRTAQTKLDIESNPAGNIYVNNKFVGLTPAQIHLDYSQGIEKKTRKVSYWHTSPGISFFLTLVTLGIYLPISLIPLDIESSFEPLDHYKDNTFSVEIEADGLKRFNEVVVAKGQKTIPIKTDFAKATAIPIAKAEILPADSIAPIVKPTMQTKPVIPSIAPSKGLPPSLSYSYSIHDANNNRILDGGEEIALRVEIENKGEGLAKDVQVILTGNQTLISYLGENKAVGDIRGGEKKTVEFKTILPPRILAATAELSIEVKEGTGYAPAELRTLKVAMKPAHLKESVEIISEINVDDIPLKVKGYERKDDFAIVIGISDYREKSIPAVKYAKRDAEIMAGYLQNVGGIPKTNIKVLTDEGATKSDIEAHMEDWLQRRVSERSTVFVYYAGHGAPDTQSREAYILPYEGHPDFPSKLYPLKKMYESLNKLPARNMVVMLDSCFSGSGGRSVAKAGGRDLVIVSIEDPILARGKIMVLAAATGTQISSDYDKAQHGLFTYYLLKGMSGEADRDTNGTIEIGEMYDYVRKNVSDTASIELNRDQTPVLLPSAEVAGNRLKIPLAIIK